MVWAPVPLAQAVEATKEELDSFTHLLQNKEIKESDVNKLISTLDKQFQTHETFIHKDWEATPVADIDEELIQRVLSAISYIQTNALTSSKHANFANILLGLWKRFERAKSDLKSYRKRIRIQKVDDMEFRPGKK